MDGEYKFDEETGEVTSLLSEDRFGRFDVQWNTETNMLYFDAIHTKILFKLGEKECWVHREYKDYKSDCDLL